ncbi:MULTISPECIES: response regulator transcription factor [Bifidobacterium]|jgi:DNA-binding response OmpR family regulator|uniref:DNA-binding response regulator n=1 Tax=Bifidobacterium tibiigranuli TaxID=2172043 RepID=A0A5N6S0J1_9BIFI|nr:response regulator transcription factor [Bifidobacterium tibiigranuli]KAE8128056.1 DNA-binding response regulator [Bifidobacterium tibiigranuli]KAE8128216.1 DNA-binding response regulator [Bifidobacterium tibiigranuli]MCH3974052.1 response regulator transcription factor [Bifidobacterium tibiigranuli]MCH4189082.1 response regulator transcription factor [Bifidobacterium tibiigranuli]MCH4204042.1 response regulator transcription factor [Bifidobacterium tibiigranuli]
MARILIVEDDADLSPVLDDCLRHEGYATAMAGTGVEALDALSRESFDVMLLDRDLPVLSGDEVMRAVDRLHVPVRTLMLTAAGGIDDRVQGLDLGADDYLPKPFAYPELLARIRALLRRGDADAPTLLIHGRLAVDTVRRLAYADSRPLDLAPREYGVLEELLRADGGWVGTNELLESLWPAEAREQPDVVKTTIYSLRRRLPDSSLIASSRGEGYRIP